MNLARKLVMALAASAVTVIGAELVARAFPVETALFQPEPERLFATVPKARAWVTSSLRANSELVEVALNSRGLRGPELDSLKTRRRVVVFGDSMVMAEYVREAATFPARLRATGFEDAEVVNAGVTGYGPDQTLLVMQRELPELQPDLAVLVLCATNDLGDLLRDKLFRLGNHGELVPTPHRLADEMIHLFEVGAQRASRPALVRWLDFLSRRHAAMQRSRKESLAPAKDSISSCLLATEWEYANAVVEQDPRVYNLFQDTYDADVAIHPDAPSSTYKRDLLQAVLRSARELCDERHVPLYVVVAPPATDLDPTFRIRVDRARFPTYSPETLSRVVASASEGAGLPTLSLYELFAARNPATLFIGGDDFHWSERGIDLAARATAAWLREQR